MVFSFHPLFIGGNPFRASAIYSIVPYLERLGGVHFTRAVCTRSLRQWNVCFAHLAVKCAVVCQSNKFFFMSARDWGSAKGPDTRFMQMQ